MLLSIVHKHIKLMLFLCNTMYTYLEFNIASYVHDSISVEAKSLLNECLNLFSIITFEGRCAAFHIKIMSVH